LPAGESEGDGSTVVGLSVTETASTITFLSDNGASTLATREATARAGAVGVRSASTGDELSSGCFGGGGGWCNSATGGCSSGLPAWETQRYSGAIIRLSVTEATTAISFLSNDGAGTFAGSESTAGTCAVSVSLANTSDELGPWRLARENGGRNKGCADREKSKDNGDLVHHFCVGE
jgi:hypothetical protein